MGRTKRRDAGDGSVYQQSDGLWVVAMPLPDGPGGKRRRKVVRRRDKVDALAALRKMRADLERSGDLATASPTVESWLTYWLREISAKRVRPKTQSERERDVRLYITPSIGKRRLDKLTPAHVREMHAYATQDGRSSTTALRCHRLISVALRDAVRAGRVTRNVATSEYMDAPRAAVVGVATLSVEQVRSLLAACAEDTQAVRWLFGLLTGARVGEALGLEWSRVDWRREDVTLSWQLQRIIWQHGCGGACGYARVSYCPQRLAPLPDGFERRAIDGADSLHLVRPKTRGSWRVVPLVDPLRSLLRAAWVAAGEPAAGFVFTAAQGVPLSPEADYKAWRSILGRAGLDLRRHDARHTAATLLLTLGVDGRTVQQILGHSSAAMTAHYQHVDQTMAREALGRLGDALALPALPAREGDGAR